MPVTETERQILITIIEKYHKKKFTNKNLFKKNIFQKILRKEELLKWIFKRTLSIMRKNIKSRLNLE